MSLSISLLQLPELEVVNMRLMQGNVQRLVVKLFKLEPCEYLAAHFTPLDIENAHFQKCKINSCAATRVFL